MFQEAVHDQQENTHQGDHTFPGQITRFFSPNQNTDRDEIKSIRLDSANIIFLFFTHN
jgi:hypothetical protein